MEEIAQVLCNVTDELKSSEVFIELHHYLESQEEIPVDSIYLISKPIMESNEYEYDYKNGFLLLIKNHKVMFFTTDSLDNDDFITFKEDFWRTQELLLGNSNMLV